MKYVPLIAGIISAAVLTGLVIATDASVVAALVVALVAVVSVTAGYGLVAPPKNKL